MEEQSNCEENEWKTQERRTHNSDISNGNHEEINYSFNAKWKKILKLISIHSSKSTKL